MSPATFTLKDFERWLKAQPPQSSIGYAGRCRACPLAKFLRETSGADVVVHLTDYLYGTMARKMPKWAQSFIISIDTRFRNGEFISAEAGLHLLNLIQPYRGSPREP